MLAGEVTTEVLVVEVNPHVNNPIPEVHPVEPSMGSGMAKEPPTVAISGGAEAASRRSRGV